MRFWVCGFLAQSEGSYKEDLSLRLFHEGVNYQDFRRVELRSEPERPDRNSTLRKE